MRSRLNVVLAEKRVTKTALARELCVHRQSVHVWSTDKGMAGLTVGKLCRVARALGCDPREVFEP